MGGCEWYECGEVRVCMGEENRGENNAQITRVSLASHMTLTY